MSDRREKLAPADRVRSHRVTQPACRPGEKTIPGSSIAMETTTNKVCQLCWGLRARLRFGLRAMMSQCWASTLASICLATSLTRDGCKGCWAVSGCESRPAHLQTAALGQSQNRAASSRAAAAAVSDSTRRHLPTGSGAQGSNLEGRVAHPVTRTRIVVGNNALREAQESRNPGPFGKGQPESAFCEVPAEGMHELGPFI
ncbi:hypothetical protein AAFF_G00008460 [Aldrovandia affinis]|uniref:Uncharacterized protein n=1 Tax=Aldrovandia affinis TaxID=143900 RepID=A0AAD7T6L7_9TELE|nr:hypothetical protein AAFF_G00008460 [Aldrovandia affinis]